MLNFHWIRRGATVRAFLAQQTDAADLGQTVHQTIYTMSASTHHHDTRFIPSSFNLKLSRGDRGWQFQHQIIPILHRLAGEKCQTWEKVSSSGHNYSVDLTRRTILISQNNVPGNEEDAD